MTRAFAFKLVSIYRPVSKAQVSLIWNNIDTNKKIKYARSNEQKKKINIKETSSLDKQACVLNWQQFEKRLQAFKEREKWPKLELLKDDINKNMNGLSFVSILFDINYYVYFLHHNICNWCSRVFSHSTMAKTETKFDGQCGDDIRTNPTIHAVFIDTKCQKLNPYNIIAMR